MRLSELIQIVAGLLVLGGSFFCFVAALGIVRMQDVLIRMHASSKAGTLGSGMVLLGVAFYFAEVSIVARCLAAIAFLVITAPIGSHMIGRAAYAYGVKLWEGTVADEMRGKHLDGGRNNPPAKPAVEQSPPA